MLELVRGLSLESGVATHTAILDGRPAPELLDYVANLHADAIALGSHGYGLWKRLTLGSVSSKVLVQPLGSLAAPAQTIGPEPQEA